MSYFRNGYLLVSVMLSIQFIVLKTLDFTGRSGSVQAVGSTMRCVQLLRIFLSGV